jgi:hypothetical protein
MDILAWTDCVRSSTDKISYIGIFSSSILQKYWYFLTFYSVYPIKSDYKIGICCFSAKHTALRRKSKDWLARNQNNVSEWSDMSTRWLLFQWASIIKIQLSKKFSVCIFILISFQALSRVFWKFNIWPPGAFRWIFWHGRIVSDQVQIRFHKKL